MEAESFAAFDEEFERTLRSIPAASVLAESGPARGDGSGGGASGADKTGTGAVNSGNMMTSSSAPVPSWDQAQELSQHINGQQQQQQQHLRTLDVTARWNVARKVSQSIDRHLVPNIHLAHTARKLLRVGERLTALGIYSTARSKCFKPIIKQQRYAGGKYDDGVGIVDATEAHVRAIYLSATALVDQSVTSSDPTFETPESLEVAMKALERIQVGMQISLEIESLYWLAFNGTVHTMRLSMDLMVAGYPDKVIAFILYCIVVIESIVMLCAPRYLDWRCSCYEVGAACFFGLGRPEEALKLAQRGVGKLKEQLAVEALDPTPMSKNEKTLYDSALTRLSQLEVAYAATCEPQSVSAEIEKLGDGEDADLTRLSALLVTLRGDPCQRHSLHAPPSERIADIFTEAMKIAGRLASAIKDAASSLHESEEKLASPPPAASATDGSTVNTGAGDPNGTDLGDGTAELEEEVLHKKFLLTTSLSRFPIAVHSQCLRLAYEYEDDGSLDTFASCARVRADLANRDAPAGPGEAGNGQQGLENLLLLLKLMESITCVEKGHSGGPVEDNLDNVHKLACVLDEAMQIDTIEGNQHCYLISNMLLASGNLVLSNLDGLAKAHSSDWKTLDIGAMEQVLFSLRVTCVLQQRFKTGDFVSQSILAIRFGSLCLALLRHEGYTKEVRQKIKTLGETITILLRANDIVTKYRERFEGDVSSQSSPASTVDGAPSQPTPSASFSSSSLLHDGDRTSSEVGRTLRCISVDLVMLTTKLQLQQGEFEQQERRAMLKLQQRREMDVREQSSKIFGKVTVSERKRFLQKQASADAQQLYPGHTERALLEKCGSDSYKRALILMQAATFRDDQQKASEMLNEAMRCLHAAKLYEDTFYKKHRSDMSSPVASSSKFAHFPAPQVARCTTTELVISPPTVTLKSNSTLLKRAHTWAVFVKTYGSGVAVSTNNTDFDGSGIKRSLTDAITIRGLSPNSTYMVAYAVYDENSLVLSPGISSSTDKVHTVLPLPLLLCWSYLAESSYRCGCGSMLKTAGKLVHDELVNAHDYLVALVSPLTCGGSGGGGGIVTVGSANVANVGCVTAGGTLDLGGATGSDDEEDRPVQAIVETEKTEKLTRFPAVKDIVGLMSVPLVRGIIRCLLIYSMDTIGGRNGGTMDLTGQLNVLKTGKLLLFAMELAAVIGDVALVEETALRTHSVLLPLSKRRECNITILIALMSALTYVESIREKRSKALTDACAFMAYKADIYLVDQSELIASANLRRLQMPILRDYDFGELPQSLRTLQEMILRHPDWRKLEYAELEERTHPERGDFAAQMLCTLNATTSSTQSSAVVTDELIGKLKRAAESGEPRCLEVFFMLCEDAKKRLGEEDRLFSIAEELFSSIGTLTMPKQLELEPIQPTADEADNNRKADGDGGGDSAAEDDVETKKRLRATRVLADRLPCLYAHWKGVRRARTLRDGSLVWKARVHDFIATSKSESLLEFVRKQSAEDIVAGTEEEEAEPAPSPSKESATGKGKGAGEKKGSAKPQDAAASKKKEAAASKKAKGGEVAQKKKDTGGRSKKDDKAEPKAAVAQMEEGWVEREFVTIAKGFARAAEISGRCRRWEDLSIAFIKLMNHSDLFESEVENLSLSIALEYKVVCYRVLDMLERCRGSTVSSLEGDAVGGRSTASGAVPVDALSHGGTEVRESWLTKADFIDADKIVLFVKRTMKVLERVEKFNTIIDIGENFNRLTDDQYAESILARILKARRALNHSVEADEHALSLILRDKSLAVEILHRCRHYCWEQIRPPALTPHEQTATGNLQAASLTATAQTLAPTTNVTKAMNMYKNAIEKLSYRGETFLVSIAQSELGDVLYKHGDIAGANLAWNDSLDTTFSTYGVLSKWHDAVEGGPNLYKALGDKGCFLGVVNLYKISKFTAKDESGMPISPGLPALGSTHLKIECALMASRIVLVVFSSSLTHPTEAVNFSDYTPTEMWEGKDIFDPFECNATELKLALEHLSAILIDCDMFIEVQPMLSLLEHIIATKFRDVSAIVRCRLLRLKSLYSCGRLRKAKKLMWDVTYGKGLPSPLSGEVIFKDESTGKVINMEYPLGDDEQDEIIEKAVAVSAAASSPSAVAKKSSNAKAAAAAANAQGADRRKGGANVPQSSTSTASSSHRKGGLFNMNVIDAVMEMQVPEVIAAYYGEVIMDEIALAKAEMLAVYLGAINLYVMSMEQVDEIEESFKTSLCDSIISAANKVIESAQSRSNASSVMSLCHAHLLIAKISDWQLNASDVVRHAEHAMRALSDLNEDCGDAARGLISVVWMKCRWASAKAVFEIGDKHRCRRVCLEAIRDAANQDERLFVLRLVHIQVLMDIEEGDIESALLGFKEIKDRYAQLRVPNSPHYAAVLADFGSLMGHLGQLSSAVKLCEEAVSIAMTMLSDHGVTSLKTKSELLMFYPHSQLTAAILLRAGRTHMRLEDAAHIDQAKLRLLQARDVLMASPTHPRQHDLVSHALLRAQRTSRRQQHHPTGGAADEDAEAEEYKQTKLILRCMTRFDGHNGRDVHVMRSSLLKLAEKIADAGSAATTTTDVDKCVQLLRSSHELGKVDEAIFKLSSTLSSAGTSKGNDVKTHMPSWLLSELRGYETNCFDAGAAAAGETDTAAASVTATQQSILLCMYRKLEMLLRKLNISVMIEVNMMERTNHIFAILENCSADFKSSCGLAGCLGLLRELVADIGGEAHAIDAKSGTPPSSQPSSSSLEPGLVLWQWYVQDRALSPNRNDDIGVAIDSITGDASEFIGDLQLEHAIAESTNIKTRLEKCLPQQEARLVYLIVRPKTDADDSETGEGDLIKGVLDCNVRDVLAAHRQARAKLGTAEDQLVSIFSKNSAGGPLSGGGQAPELPEDSEARRFLPSLLDIDGGGLDVVNVHLASFLSACISSSTSA